MTTSSTSLSSFAEPERAPRPAARALGPARVWCSDRHGGVSSGPFATLNLGDHVGDDVAAVGENRRRLATATCGIDPETWVWLRQVHGTSVLTVTAPGPSGPPRVADAAVTNLGGVPLVVLAADCAPVALACEDAVGVVHAGWSGLLAGVIEEAVDALRRVGAGEVRALVGPCIRVERYEFGTTDLGRLVAHLGPDVEGVTADGHPALDIPAATRIALGRAGVTDVEEVGTCTAASADHFSHRRDGVTGRQALMAVLAP